ncbi:MAG: DUF4010 domain-containing protein [Gammaproteobacteria bacterium]|nr:DUF4010 domain-containing protein [Gammaproteobacteria bacterium]
MTMSHVLLSFFISLLMGLLIGIEREHSHAEGVEPIGIRAFILFSLMGTVAALINQIQLTFIISAFVFSIIIFGYFRTASIKRKKINIGITTEVSAGIVYCLGYLTFFENLISAIVASFVLLVLIERQRLHKLARKKFKAHEIETVIILVIFALGIIPILPNNTVDPWHLFNPRNFAILIMTMAVIQFSGYVAIKLFGERVGLALMGFLGGFVSSTLVFANLPHTLNSHPKSKLAVIASALFATLAMLIEVMAIIFVASPAFLFYIIKPMITMCPLNLLFLFRTALLIAGTLVLIALARHFVGTEAVFIISFLTGLFEIHGISLATALLYLNQHLLISTASSILFTALLAAFLSKILLLWSLAPWRFALQTSLCLLAMVISGGITYWFWM